MDPPTLALMKLHKLHPTLSASRTFILSVSYLLGTSYQYVTPQSKVENLGPVKLTRGQPRHPEEAEVHNFRLGSTEYIHGMLSRTALTVTRTLPILRVRIPEYR